MKMKVTGAILCATLIPTSRPNMLASSSSSVQFAKVKAWQVYDKMDDKEGVPWSEKGGGGFL